MAEGLGLSVAEQFPEITPEIRNQYPSVTDENILENYPLLSIKTIDACHGLEAVLDKSRALREEEKKKSPVKYYSKRVKKFLGRIVN